MACQPVQFTGQQSARVKSPESTERASDRGLDDRSSWRQRILVPARCLDQAGVIPISPPDFPGTTHCDMVSAFWPATQDGPGGGGFFDGQIGLLGLRYLVIFLFEVYSTMPPLYTSLYCVLTSRQINIDIIISSF